MVLLEAGGEEKSKRRPRGQLMSTVLISSKGVSQ
jgi:hypothetical protein